MQEEKKNRDFQTQTSSPEELEQRATVLRAAVTVLNRRLDTWKESHIFHTQAVQHETFQDAIAQFHEAQNEADRVDMICFRLFFSLAEMSTWLYCWHLLEAISWPSILSLGVQIGSFGNAASRGPMSREGFEDKVEELKSNWKKALLLS